MLLVFECVEMMWDEVEWEWLLSFVIVGGGLMGVEMVGVLVELVWWVLVDDFCCIDLMCVWVYLVEVVLWLLLMFLE